MALASSAVINDSGAGPAGSINGLLASISTGIASLPGLRAYTGLATALRTLYRSIPGDGGGNNFYLNSSDVTSGCYFKATSSGTVLSVSSVTSGSIQPNQAIAGNGCADQTYITNFCKFSGTIAGTVLTITALTQGFSLPNGATITGPGVTAGTTIVSANADSNTFNINISQSVPTAVAMTGNVGTGTGGAGTYQITTSQTLAGSAYMTADNGSTIIRDGLGRNWYAANIKQATAEQCGIFNDGSDYSGAMAAAVQALSVLNLNATVPAPYIGSGGAGAPIQPYMGTFHIYKSNFSLLGPGIGICTVKQPNGTLAPGGVCELFPTAMAPLSTPQTGINVIGVNFDGNESGTAQPNTDVQGWGIPLTNVQNSTFDASAANCWCGGVGVFLLSNGNKGKFTVTNCGQTGSVTSGPEAGFDINESSNNVFDIVSVGCQYGLRLFVNCNNNIIKASIQNATFTGLVLNNYLSYTSSGNIITADITGGLIGNTVQVGSGAFSNTLNINQSSPSGTGVAGVLELGASFGIATALIPTGNIYTIVSNGMPGYAAQFGGNATRATVSSNLDGRAGAAGTYNALNVYGNDGEFDVTVIDGSTFQVRAVALYNAAATGTTGGASNNRCRIKTSGNSEVAFAYQDGGTGNSVLRQGQTTIVGTSGTSGVNALPINGDTVLVTGAATLAYLDPSKDTGQSRFFVFQDGIQILDLTQTGGANIDVGGVNLTVQADLPYVGYCDGTNWHIGSSPVGQQASSLATLTESANFTLVAAVLTASAFPKVVITGSPSGGITATTDTAAAIIALLRAIGVTNGNSWPIRILNTTAQTITVAGGTGVTTSGTMTIATNTSRDFNVKQTSPTTITITNAGSGGV